MQYPPSSGTIPHPFLPILPLSVIDMLVIESRWSRAGDGGEWMCGSESRAAGAPVEPPPPGADIADQAFGRQASCGAM